MIKENVQNGRLTSICQHTALALSFALVQK